MKLDFRKYFATNFSICRFFFHLKKIDLRFFYLRLFVTGASLNSTAPVRRFVTPAPVRLYVQ